MHYNQRDYNLWRYLHAPPPHKLFVRTYLWGASDVLLPSQLREAPMLLLAHVILCHGKSSSSALACSLWLSCLNWYAAAAKGSTAYKQFLTAVLWEVLKYFNYAIPLFRLSFNEEEKTTNTVATRCISLEKQLIHIEHGHRIYKRKAATCMGASPAEEQHYTGICKLRQPWPCIWMDGGIEIPLRANPFDCRASKRWWWLAACLRTWRLARRRVGVRKLLD